MKKVVHPTIMRYREKIRKVREELKYWKRKYRGLKKKYDKDMGFARDKLFKSRFGDFGKDL